MARVQPSMGENRNVVTIPDDVWPVVERIVGSERIAKIAMSPQIPLQFSGSVEELLAAVDQASKVVESERSGIPSDGEDEQEWAGGRELERMEEKLDRILERLEVVSQKLDRIPSFDAVQEIRVKTADGWSSIKGMFWF